MHFCSRYCLCKKNSQLSQQRLYKTKQKPAAKTQDHVFRLQFRPHAKIQANLKETNPFKHPKLVLLLTCLSFQLLSSSLLSKVFCATSTQLFYLLKGFMHFQIKQRRYLHLKFEMSQAGVKLMLLVHVYQSGVNQRTVEYHSRVGHWASTFQFSVALGLAKKITCTCPIGVQGSCLIN